MDYLKLRNDGDTVEFTPVEFDGEQFSLWDVQNNTFIQEGEEIETEQGMQEVNKYIKLTDEEKKSEYNRNLQFVWQVREGIHGEINYLPLKKTAQEQLKSQMETVKSAGNDPYNFVYTVKREGKGLNTEYKVKTNGPVSQVWSEESDERDEFSEGNELSAESDNGGVDVDLSINEEESGLSEREQQYVEALNSDDKVKDFTDDQKKKILVENAGVEEERAAEIVQEHVN